MVVVVLIAAYFLGVGYSFYRFGVGEGLTTISAPPYAWFRAASIIWTPPKWKEDWDLNTGNLAFVLIYDDGSDASTTYKFRQYEDDLKKWLNTVPASVRKGLRADATGLCNAYLAYGEQLINRLIRMKNAGDLDIIFKSQSVQESVDVFKHQKGFSDVWEKFRTQQMTAVAALNDQLSKLGDTSSLN